MSFSCSHLSPVRSTSSLIQLGAVAASLNSNVFDVNVVDVSTVDVFSEQDKVDLSNLLGIDNPEDFMFADESDLFKLTHEGYSKCSDSIRSSISESIALLKIKKIYFKCVKGVRFGQKQPETSSIGNNSDRSGIWGNVAVTRSCKSNERDANKFPSISGGKWEGFKDPLQRPVKVFVREVGQVSSENSMTSVEIYRYLCSQLSPSIKRELSEYLQSKFLLTDLKAVERLTECENWLLNTFQSTNSSTRLTFRLETLSQSGEPVDNYISKFRSLVWESEIVGLNWQADFLLQRFTSGLDERYAEYADSCNLLPSDVACQSTATVDRLI